MGVEDVMIACNPIVLQIDARRAVGAFLQDDRVDDWKLDVIFSKRSYMKKASKKKPKEAATTATTATTEGPARRLTRVKTSIDINWGFTEDCTFAGTIINLTVLGCAVQNREGVEVTPGKTVFIRFFMPLERILKVQVVHTSLEGVQGFGARFLDLTEDETETLDQMIQMFGEPPLYPPGEDGNEVDGSNSAS